MMDLEDDESIFLCYGGRWESSNTGQKRYVGFKTVATSISKNAKYDELYNAVCRRLDVNIEQYSVIMRITPNAALPDITLTIVSDEEVATFLELSKKGAVPVFIDVKDRQPIRHEFVDVCVDNMETESHHQGLGYNMSRGIQQDLHKDNGVHKTYMTASRAKHVERFIVGSPEDSFRLIPAYCHVLKGENPGTVTELKIDDGGHFMYFFFALGACIRGFRSFIRPVIAVHGTFLKGPYLGYMFVAVSKDGNNQIYPLAWGIVDSENDASWEWFMEKLWGVVGDMNDLAFILDLNVSIEKAICKVFPNAYYGVCIYNLLCNLVTKFQISSSKKKTDPFIGAYFQAAKAYRQADFEYQLCNMRCMKPDVVQYLQDEVGFHRWARSKGAFRKYDLMTTNIAESINAVVKEARKLSITLLVEWIREFTHNWFYDRKEVAKQISSHLTTWVDHKISKCQDYSNKMSVNQIDKFKFLVKDANTNEIVDIAVKTCSCKKFDLRQLPCSHAIAVCRCARLECQVLCSSYYTIETLVATYDDLVNPVGHPSKWVVPDEVRSILILPPLVRKKLGRRRSDLISSRGENLSKKACSRCKQHGHNRATCRNPAISSSQ